MDRNDVLAISAVLELMSLSARRAWIEIRGARPIGSACPVALRKESVDRNFKHHSLNLPSRPSLSARRAWIEIINPLSINCMTHTSLSARRAWIEISSSLDDILAGVVALRKESVDRNSSSHV